MFIYAIAIFNNLVKYKNLKDNAFAQIDVQLHRRHDLIPNLVETCKGYMAHEKQTLETVIKARNQAITCLESIKKSGPSNNLISQLGNAESLLTQSLGQLQITIEDYPDLKANESIAQLNEELTSTENRISFARQAYNDEVMVFNTYKQSFPQNLLAGPFGHAENAPLLVLENPKEQSKAPSVSF
jgi:LemA protein